MDRSKRKKYFSSNLMMKKRRNLCLQVGYKGFISTCNGSEKQCIAESYNILNEYADQIFGEEPLKKKTDSKNDKNDDVMDELEKEIEGLKAKKSGEVERRFQAVDTGVFNCIFIRTNLEDPADLLDTIVRNLYNTKLKKTRFLLRMVPIEVTCKAYEDDIKKAAGPLFDKYFKSKPTSFSIVFNRRHNSNVDRDVVIKDLAQLVADRNSEHKVNLTDPNYAIIVEVIKNVCGLAVIRDYFKFSKYNFSSICGIDVSSEKQASSSKPDNEVKPDSSSKNTETDSPPEPESSTDQYAKGDDELAPSHENDDANAAGEPNIDSTMTSPKPSIPSSAEVASTSDVPDSTTSTAKAI